MMISGEIVADLREEAERVEKPGGKLWNGPIHRTPFHLYDWPSLRAFANVWLREPRILQSHKFGLVLRDASRSEDG
jgi:hypothetical protein